MKSCFCYHFAKLFCVLGCSFPLCQLGLFCSLTRVLAPAAFCCSQGCLPGLGWRNQVCCFKSRPCLWSSLASALLRRGQRCWGGDFWKFAECQARLARASAASSVPEPDQPNLHHVISYHITVAGWGGVWNKLPLLCLVSGRGENPCFQMQRQPKLENMAKNLWKWAVKGRMDSSDKGCMGKGEDG